MQPGFGHSIEEATHQGLLLNSELFLFTDNETVEAAFHKGSSSSKPLFELVLRLRLLQLHHGLFLHVIHVSGTRMKQQGTDGLSRGCLANGVLLGMDMFNFIHVHLSALDHEPGLLPWLHSWLSPIRWQLLTPFEWFTLGHQKGTFVWSPPPAAADVALEQITTATHKRPVSIYVILFPRLLTAIWRKLLWKLFDVLFFVPTGSDIWPANHHESLFIGICFPLSHHRPWHLRGTPLMDLLVGKLSALSVADWNWGGDILREFLGKARSLDSLSTSLAWEVLYCQ